MLEPEGRQPGDVLGTARLQQAVTAYQNALLERSRNRVPLDWAATQNDLGNALWTLGARESGTARLQEAVTAYQNALLELTREHDPLGRRVNVTLQMCAA
jgi:hypothetical protein